MKITICGSLHFFREMHTAAKQLRSLGHEVMLPHTAEELLRGEIKSEQIAEEKAQGIIHKRAIQGDLIRRHQKRIQEADAILVINPEKQGIAGYIGGNTFLEMGFAHVLHKSIYLLYSVTGHAYQAEIDTMKPVVLNGQLDRLTSI